MLTQDRLSWRQSSSLWMTVLLRLPNSSRFLMTVVRSWRGSRSLITVVRSRSRSRYSCDSPTVTPAPTGPARTPISSANAGDAIAVTMAAANRYFLMTSLLLEWRCGEERRVRHSVPISIRVQMLTRRCGNNAAGTSLNRHSPAWRNAHVPSVELPDLMAHVLINRRTFHEAIAALPRQCGELRAACRARRRRADLQPLQAHG